jgi:Spy/CpxP family protein refolding chaperone
MNSMTNKYSGNRLATLLLMATSLTLSTSALAAEPTADGAEQSCPAGEHGEHACSCKHGDKAGPHHGNHHGSKGGMDGMQMFERMGEEMALSDDQKQQLAALSEMYRPRFEELMQRGTESRQALLTMAPDDPAYNTTASEMSQLASLTAAEMVTLIAELQANAYALLTTEQQAEYLQLRAQQRAKMEAKKAEMEERRKAGGGKRHQCKACEWLEQDDANQAAE